MSTTWVALLVVQILAPVEVGRTDLHRRLGVAGDGVHAALVVVIGTAAALDAAATSFAPAPQSVAANFLAIPLVDLLVFSILVVTAVAKRRKSATHKRLMLLATVSMLTPAVARLPIDALSRLACPRSLGYDRLRAPRRGN